MIQEKSSERVPEDHPIRRYALQNGDNFMHARDKLNSVQGFKGLFLAEKGSCEQASELA